MKKPRLHFDPAERAAEKAASRLEDLRLLESGEISKADLVRRNAFVGSLDLRRAKILNRPNIKIKC